MRRPASAWHLFPLLLLTVSTVSYAAEAGRWSAAANGDYSSDSDTITFYKEALQSGYALSDSLSLEGQLENMNMSAGSGSGLTAIGGEKEVDLQSLLLGVKQQLDNTWTLEALAGHQWDSINNGDTPFMLKAGGHITDVQALFSVSRELYALSPRAISLGVTRTEEALQLIWQATKAFKVRGDTSYDDFSDNNSRRNIRISPLYRLMQDAASSLDAGLRFQWYGFAHHFNDGYYSPDRYQAYNVPFIYFREFGNGNHVLLSAAPGIYKDQSLNGFRFAGDATAEAVFKVSEKWDFNVHGGVIRSGGITSSEYAQRTAGIGLTRHF